MIPPSPAAPPPGPAGSGPDADFARAEALAGLAREVEGLRRAVDPLRDVGGRVEDLARLVGHLTDTVTTLGKRPAATPAPSWLLAPADPAVVEQMVGELCAWLYAVFLRYHDGAAVLPECWLCHPDVVEELVWLMHAWCVAYQGPAASVQLAGDWHDRQRPGVVRRIRSVAGSCSAEKHQTRPGWDERPTGATAVPGIDHAVSIAEWWASRRDDPAPEPAATSAPTAAPPAGPWLSTNGAQHP